MLETLDLSLTLDKASYRQQIETLMQQLHNLQSICRDKQLPIVVVLEGWAAAGKGALVRKMVQYMDPRGFTVHPIWPPTEQERYYPFLWRFWQRLPARGNLAVFYHSWYTHVLEDRLFGRVSESEIPNLFRDINAFERQLFDDGVAIVKYWIHLSRQELKSRLKHYAEHPLESWRVRPEDWQQQKNYDRYCALAEDMLISTSSGQAPWTLVEGNCERWARVKVLSQMAATLTEALDRLKIKPTPLIYPPQEKLEPTEPDLLAQVDLSKALSADAYKKRLREEQVRLRQLQISVFKENVPVLILFEGWDAAGKGGAIKRLTDILDPRSYFVYPFAAPTHEEKEHHYLWRFWRRLPTVGQIGIFDRSWYGRVLVERIENFATDEEWRRAYREINEFEAQLTGAGYVLVKFWLHISPEEQLRRFEERQNDPFKTYKLTAEDWRNREKWTLYEVAVNQMIQRTSTPTAPWTLVAANDKYYARVKILDTVSDAIERELKRRKKAD
ncbi:polyphosphate:AMP phosphotransferase [Trichothermofontia sichuanensis B231]|uniref:polyphosphate:AMP phosphotransferase n=1 Tax=Trichothermofontia sichuanensis TaxID=3045816 RepID=UPI0022464A58|nr:polyphosphate:AMP phosphotransferase [Trichothermofontia sichuanensis]UZQ53310.1 polyphosphate:AMP phosphotransferase [Trichothermofontia sichuanensis B231]